MARRSTLLGLFLFVLGLLLVEVVPAAGQSLPPRFYLAERERPTFAAMLEQSPTFRLQCKRIVQAGVIVAIAFENPFAMGDRMWARTQIVREGGQVKVARVTLRPDTPWTALLAHELEHVIEQLDGVDLPKLANGHRGEAWRVGSAFETRRARDAGDRVGQELRRGRPATLLALQTAAPSGHATP